jgi:5-methylcytosine-specific restriction endonuclease McrA
LQVDHITPLALGGTSVAENLRVLCQAHNIHAAVQVFGPKKMEKCLKPQH